MMPVATVYPQLPQASLSVATVGTLMGKQMTHLSVMIGSNVFVVQIGATNHAA